MDDKDKNVVEQIVDSVNDLVESIANTASEALEPATRSPGPKPKRQSVPDYEFPAPSGGRVELPVAQVAGARAGSPRAGGPRSRINENQTGLAFSISATF